MSKPSIRKAETDKVEELEEYIDELLVLVGHPEAMVTDRSILWDFFGNDAEAAADDLSGWLGFKVYRNTYLVDIAKEMKAIDEEDR